MRHVVAHIGEDRGPDIPAVVEARRACPGRPTSSRRALVDPGLDHRLNPVVLHLRRTADRCGRPPRPDRPPSAPRPSLFAISSALVETAAFHQHPGRRVAATGRCCGNSTTRPSGTRASRSASANTRLGDLPPSSSVTRLTLSAASFETRMPARVEPVNDIMAMSGWRDMRRADRRAVALDEVEHARPGTPASCRISANSGADSGACSDGFKHAGAAGRQRRHHLQRDLADRPVPRRDQAADPDRLARQHIAARQYLTFAAAPSAPR